MRQVNLTQDNIPLTQPLPDDEPPDLPALIERGGVEDVEEEEAVEDLEPPAPPTPHTAATITNPEAPPEPILSLVTKLQNVFGDHPVWTQGKDQTGGVANNEA